MPEAFAVSLFLELEAVLEAHGAVEHQVLLGGVLVGAEVAQAHELEAVSRLGVCQGGLHPGAGDHRQGVGIQAVQEVLVGAVRIRVGEQIVVEPDLRLHGGFRVHPMEGGALDLPSVGRVAAPGIRVVGAGDGRDIALRVLFAAGAGDEYRRI